MMDIVSNIYATGIMIIIRGGKYERFGVRQ